MKKLLIASLLIFAACAAGTDESASGPRQASPVPSGTGTPAIELQSEFEFEAYPGSTWYSPDGGEVPDESNIINAITGPDHCEWESGVMMHVGWPLGHDAADISESRQYIRDPEKVFPQNHLMTTFVANVDLPKAAEYTGYRTEFMELWLDESDNTAAYLVFTDHVERWPRAGDVIACA